MYFRFVEVLFVLCLNDLGVFFLSHSSCCHGSRLVQETLRGPMACSKAWRRFKHLKSLSMIWTMCFWWLYSIFSKMSLFFCMTIHLAINVLPLCSVLESTFMPLYISHHCFPVRMVCSQTPWRTLHWCHFHAAMTPRCCMSVPSERCHCRFLSIDAHLIRYCLSQSFERSFGRFTAEISCAICLADMLRQWSPTCSGPTHSTLCIHFKLLTWKDFCNL